jgi:hypothetical protein
MGPPGGYYYFIFNNTKLPTQARSGKQAPMFISSCVHSTYTVHATPNPQGSYAGSNRVVRSSGSLDLDLDIKARQVNKLLYFGTETFPCLSLQALDSSLGTIN